MNLLRPLFLSLALALVAQLAFAQGKEDILLQDPVKAFQVFPNPATDYITVKLADVSLKKTRISLHNIIGNELEFESEVMDESELKIKVKDLPTGYYFLSVRVDQVNSRGTFKFLKR